MTPEEACKWKIPYRSKSSARQVGLSTIQKRRLDHMLYVYKCSVCGLYHLTKAKQDSPSAAVNYERQR